jgi:hypothetical protein
VAKKYDFASIHLYIHNHSQTGKLRKGLNMEDHLSGGTERGNSDNYRKKVKTRPVGMRPNFSNVLEFDSKYVIFAACR